jgi:hypothetical protein
MKQNSENFLFFEKVDRFWKELREFCFENRTIFEIIFILLYSIEQIMLILFTIVIKDIEELVAIVSIFAVIVLTTFALHKTMMESRIKKLEESLQDAF